MISVVLWEIFGLQPECLSLFEWRSLFSFLCYFVVLYWERAWEKNKKLVYMQVSGKILCVKYCSCKSYILTHLEGDGKGKSELFQPVLINENSFMLLLKNKWFYDWKQNGWKCFLFNVGSNVMVPGQGLSIFMSFVYS